MKRVFGAAAVAGDGVATPRLSAGQGRSGDRRATRRSRGVSGNINSVGSDTMNNLMTLWAEAFQKLYPNVKIQVEGKGSSTAPPALIAGTAQFGPMSRAMSATEIDQFEQKYGYKPTQLRTSYDALAVYVNKDNPIEKLTLAQVDAIFSKTRKRGFKETSRPGASSASPATGRAGRSASTAATPPSGTYGFFKEHALGNGDYKDTVKEQPGSASVVQGVTEDRFGIGYSGIGYKTSGRQGRAPRREGRSARTPTATTSDVMSGKYPLNRFLFLYINRAPGKPLDPLRQGVREAHLQQGRPGGRGEGRLPAPHRRDREAGAGEARVADPPGRAFARPPPKTEITIDGRRRPRPSPRSASGSSRQRPHQAGQG